MWCAHLYLHAPPLWGCPGPQRSPLGPWFSPVRLTPKGVMPSHPALLLLALGIYHCTLALPTCLLPWWSFVGSACTVRSTRVRTHPGMHTRMHTEPTWAHTGCPWSMFPDRHTVVPRYTQGTTHAYTRAYIRVPCQPPSLLPPGLRPLLRLPGLLRRLRKGQQRGKGGLVKDTSKEREKKK